jgi:hypothetical protein
MELTTFHTCNRIHDNISKKQTCITYIIKHGCDSYLLARVKPPTTCRPSTNLPTLDHVSHETKLTPELGLSSTRRGIPSLGKVNKKVTQLQRKDSLLEETYVHYSQTLIPHMPIPPQEYAPSLSHSPSAAQPPFPWASTTEQTRILITL